MPPQVTLKAESDLALEQTPWTVKAISWLLGVETAVYIGLAVYHWLNTGPFDPQQFLQLLWQVVATSGLLSTAALLCLLATFFFWRLMRIGWGIAMLAQAVSLVISLLQYYSNLQFYTYFMMLFAIFMVVYLHHPDVQAAFQTHREIENTEEV